MMTLLGIDAVILFDLLTFAVAFGTLLLFIRIPAGEKPAAREPVMKSVRSGLTFLRENRGILSLVMFLAAINLVASMFNATLLPAPKSRVRVVCWLLLLSMSTENFFLAFGKSLPVWCVGAFLGWIGIPLMTANLDAILRLNIPTEMQGRVYSARNTLQFFTIPLGYFLGGWLVDAVFEPLMAADPSALLITLFGAGKGSGAAMSFAFQAVAGVVVCLWFMKDRHLRTMMKEELNKSCNGPEAAMPPGRFDDYGRANQFSQ